LRGPGVSFWLTSECLAETSDVVADGRFKFVRFTDMPSPLCHEARHLFLKKSAIVFESLGTDIVPRREHIAVRGDFGGSGGFLSSLSILPLGEG
jgi:hypothetical protein